MLKCSVLSIVPLTVILSNDLLLSPGPCVRRDSLWGSVSRSPHPLPVASCVPGRCDFHRPALTGDWVPGVKLGPFSLARAPWGAQALPQMGEYSRGACLRPGGCDSSRPWESVWTGAKVLAATLTLS